MNNIETNPTNVLKSFNETIKVEVSVDNIAEKMFEMMDKSNPHAALLVNTVIGQALSNDRRRDISRIYNALTGYEDKLDFTPGQVLYCKDTVYDRLQSSTSQHRLIGVAVVTEIDPLRDYGQVQITFKRTETRGGKNILVDEQKWVDKGMLSVPTQEQLTGSEALIEAYERANNPEAFAEPAVADLQ